MYTPIRNAALMFLTLSLVPFAAAQKGGTACPPVVDASVLTSMPVKELAVFKDGHAFVLHEGGVPTDPDGNVVLDSLPTPVIGTFWPYSADQRATLTSVVAGTRDVASESTALNLPELLRANPGAAITVTEHSGEPYSATIIGIPVDETEDTTATPTNPNAQGRQPAAQNPPPRRTADVILLRVADGVRVVPLSRIRDVKFRDEPAVTVKTREERKLLTLKLDWKNQPAGDTANVGMVYLQKGVRWIPSYRVELDGEGNARLRMQATLINELGDFEDATVHLVIGVPSFYFKDTLDPIALQDSAAQLSQYFQEAPQMAYGFSNAIMTQTARMGEYTYGPSTPAPTAVDTGIAEPSKREDMFVFEVRHVTLRKGERLVMPITEFPLKYEDVFVVDLPFAPPPEVMQNMNGNQTSELLRMLNAPRAMHRIRLTNDSAYPLTTAPAIILRKGQLLAQSLMTYTAIGAKCDLDVISAMDVSVAKSDVETSRTPNAETWGGSSYGRVDLAGTITLTNHRGGLLKLEVSRRVLGLGDAADADGKVVQSNLLEDEGAWPAGRYPSWWGWYNWPYWWFRYNGVGRFTWNVELRADERVELHYNWHYFWR